ncbi:hypothetical protein [Thiomicrospira microaerophila]|uniref:hypothetical protein n=1 Tax=Thiomicrospira microaerophila TaxID=406020 RepID=UPI0005CAD385|nr:hypothetical protein [Thiomicrospira microaerophila]
MDYIFSIILAFMFAIGIITLILTFLLHVKNWIVGLFGSSTNNNQVASSTRSNSYVAKSSVASQSVATRSSLVATTSHTPRRSVYELDESDVYVVREYEKPRHVARTNRYCGEAHKDHTEAVWNRMGFRVKSGECYAYRYYGREIYSPDQVVSMNDYSGLSHNQKKVKKIGSALVARTGSKAHAKSILVEQYGFSESTAKYATGYRGYYNY